MKQRTKAAAAAKDKHVVTCEHYGGKKRWKMHKENNSYRARQDKGQSSFLFYVEKINFVDELMS
jgi:hypothetical protein